ncbi:MAG: ABC transporter substrate-binding protein [Lentisphaerae bacterium]|jgi:microcin C transport system substrate-binding protein|nr:ABC transporter substrate-binding protein [Lentisphaerota bacterium]
MLFWRLWICIGLTVSGLTCMGQTFPPAGWEDTPDPLAGEYATVGGEVVDYAGQSPKSLNYYLDNNVFTARVFGVMYETLIDMNPLTLEYEPYLARQWTISEDKKVFTFKIDPRARWSDGVEITAHDVLWTYQAVMDPKNMTGVHKGSLERLEVPEVLDKHTIRFTAKEVHWRNLGTSGGFYILPKHVFAESDFNKINFEFPVVSGPYRIGELKEGLYATLERREDWWRRAFPSSRGKGNFQRIKYKFFADRPNAFEAFKKGEIDVFAVYTSYIWVNETQGEKFDRNWIVKQKIYNHHPIGFQGFAMNMRRFPFDDRRVRKAMAHLLDRDKMNRTLMYNKYFLHRSYYEDLYHGGVSCPNTSTVFSKDAARALLAEAGWQANAETGILEKDGKPFRFKFLTRSASSEKFLAIYGEDLKDVGIEMAIDKKDWAAWAKDMDDFSYEMTWAAWGAGLFKDPELMWASKEADRKGGNNITGFKNARVDELVEKQKTIFDVASRHAICREVDALIFNDFPYVLLWNIDYVRLLYWNKFGVPDTVLSKYGTESTSYWWYDEDAAAELSAVQKSGEALPRKLEVVTFDDAFSPTESDGSSPAEAEDASGTVTPRPDAPEPMGAPPVLDETGSSPLISLVFGGLIVVLALLGIASLIRRRRST